MDETTKTKQYWTDYERSFLVGEGIDIGCGPDPVSPTVLRFDKVVGDANAILDFVHRKFDYVFSSHCLEHMLDAKQAVRQWWELVKPGGVLFLLVPDEDLYEQGFFPSRFNPDHKWTFTISKRRSWSRVSISLLPLLSSLPKANVLSVELQDCLYDRRLMSFGSAPTPLDDESNSRERNRMRSVKQRAVVVLKRALAGKAPVDQTTNDLTLAQIQAIVRKE